MIGSAYPPVSTVFFAKTSSSATPSDQQETSSPDARQARQQKADSSQDPERVAQLQQLKNRDREVRAHELAHVAAGGQYVTSGAQFSYQKGPDGRLYAVAGEVSIDTSPVAGNPQATIQKAQAIIRAAMAPAEPSGQDRQVAARASGMLQQARAQLQILTEDSASSPGTYLDVTA